MDIIQLLITHGADISARKDLPLFINCEIFSSNLVSKVLITTFLARKRQFLTNRDRTGATALFRASTVENFEEGNLFLFCLAQPSIQTAYSCHSFLIYGILFGAVLRM